MMSKKIWLNIVYCIYCGHKTEYNSKYHHYTMILKFILNTEFKRFLF